MTYSAEPNTLASVPFTTSKAQLADALLNGALEANLRAWRLSQELSWDDVAKEVWIATDRRVSITGPTAQAWGAQVGIRDPQPSERTAS